MIVFTIVSEWPKYIDDDPEYGVQDFGGEPWGYHINVNGYFAYDYGDDYHDKGSHKCEAFVHGYITARKLTEDEYEVKYAEEITS